MKKIDFLEELSSGEDEFDVDLMACGCRMVKAGEDLLKSFNAARIADKFQLNPQQVLDLLDGVMTTQQVDTRVIEHLAQQISSTGTWNRGLEPTPIAPAKSAPKRKA